MLRREEVFSVWFTLKPSLIPVWWLPWVFTVPDLTPIALTQSNFWALFELPWASYLIMNRKKRGRIIYENLAAWNPHTGSIIIIKACPSGLTRDHKKRGWWTGIRKKKTKEKKKVSVCLSKFKRWIQIAAFKMCLASVFFLGGIKAEWLFSNVQRMKKWQCYSQLTAH